MEPQHDSTLTPPRGVCYRFIDKHFEFIRDFFSPSSFIGTGLLIRTYPSGKEVWNSPTYGWHQSQALFLSHHTSHGLQGMWNGVGICLSGRICNSHSSLCRESGLSEKNGDLRSLGIQQRAQISAKKRGMSGLLSVEEECRLLLQWKTKAGWALSKCPPPRVPVLVENFCANFNICWQGCDLLMQRQRLFS